MDSWLAISTTKKGPQASALRARGCRSGTGGHVLVTAPHDRVVERNGHRGLSRLVTCSKVLNDRASAMPSCVDVNRADMGPGEVAGGDRPGPTGVPKRAEADVWANVCG